MNVKREFIVGLEKGKDLDRFERHAVFAGLGGNIGEIILIVNSWNHPSDTWPSMSCAE